MAATSALRERAVLSKIDDAGQIKIVRRGHDHVAWGKVASEASAAEASWGLFKDDHLIVADGRDSQAALVQAVWQQAEDACSALEPLWGCQGLLGQRVFAIARSNQAHQ